MEREALELLLSVAEYLLQEHRDAIEAEQASGDQAGPWDERDHLFEAVETTSALLGQVRDFRSRLAEAD